MRRWRVLIAEDDPDVARLHRLLVDHHPAFTAIGVSEAGEQVLRDIAGLRPDLLLLDLELHGMDGLEVLSWLRRLSYPVEVIAVTAADDREIVRRMMRLGIVDYLVKPFAPERMRVALARFSARSAGLPGATVTQEAVDAVLGAADARRMLPRGLQPDTLDRLRRELEKADGWLSTQELGSRLDVAAVTVRRYLEYLVVNQEAAIRLEGYGSPGRPRKLYRSVGRADGDEWQA
ncbi:MAG: response regulator [Actinobacteria bacterium]|nr:response regulator [Actinomycetota bacterium]